MTLRRNRTGALVAAGLGLLGLVASISAVATPARADAGDPIGAFDSISLRLPFAESPNSATWLIRGWAADPDADGAPISVHIYVDGVQADLRGRGPQAPGVDADYATGTGSPGDERPDVAAVYPFAGDRAGWQSIVRIGDLRPHTVCTYAINIGSGSNNTTLGCQVLPPLGSTTNLGDPQGHLDAVSVGPGSIRVQGWAGDPDPNADTPQPLMVYLDGGPYVNANASLDRPDVRAAFPALTNAGGFDETLPVVPGFHILCVDAGNTGDYGTRNTSLGCGLQVVPGAAAQTDDSVHGAFDGFAADEQNNAFAVGWAWDPTSSGPYPVLVREIERQPVLRAPGVTGEVLVTTGRTGQPRPDVQSSFPDAPPDTGFDIQLPAQGFACAYVPHAGAEELLGCRWP